MTNPFITIPEVARMMREAGQEGSDLALKRRAYRSLEGPAFPSAFQSGGGTSAFMIKAEEAERWIALGCPTPSRYLWVPPGRPDYDGPHQDEYDRVWGRQSDDVTQADRDEWYREESRLESIIG